MSRPSVGIEIDGKVQSFSTRPPRPKKLSGDLLLCVVCDKENPYGWRTHVDGRYVGGRWHCGCGGPGVL